LFLLFGSVDVCFQIRTAIVCYRHESLHMIHSVSFLCLPALKLGDFVWSSLLNLLFLFWYISSKKHKNVYLSLYITKIRTQICLKLQNHTYIQDKLAVHGLGSVTTDIAYCYRMLANTYECKNKLMGIIITWHSQFQHCCRYRWIAMWQHFWCTAHDYYVFKNKWLPLIVTSLTSTPKVNVRKRTVVLKLEDIVTRLSDRRRGIGLTTGFIGSTLTTRGYTLQFPVTHTH
jgi:hypothetical protein